MGLFGRDNDRPRPVGAGVESHLQEIRRLAIAQDDEAVEALLRQLDAKGVPDIAQEALELGRQLWAVDEDSMAAQIVLTVVSLLDSATQEQQNESSYLAGMAFESMGADQFAISYFRLAADSGHSGAQFMLALALDGEESASYLRMAAAQGHQGALDFIAENPELAESTGQMTNSYCTACGEKVLSGARFCGGCGAAVSASPGGSAGRSGGSQSPSSLTQEFSGTGSKVLRISPIVTSALISFEVNSPSHGEVDVQCVTNEGKADYTVVQTWGTTKGTTLVSPWLDVQFVALQVQCQPSASWTLRVDAVEAAPRWDGSAISGLGNAVFKVSPSVQGFAVLAVEARSNHSIVIDAHYGELGWGTDEARVVNEFGPWAGEAVVPIGTHFIDIRCEGHWGLSIS